MSSTLTPKERVLNLLAGEPVDRVACFSGMGNITTAGLEHFGYRFQDLHSDAKKMADVAATSYKLFNYECAVVPFDLCVEAEVLGCAMNPYDEVAQILYPTVKEKIVHQPDEMDLVTIPENLESLGRVPVICQAVKYLKEDIGDKVAIGSYLLGPFTLAGQIMDLNDLFKLSFKKPKQVGALLDKMAAVIIKLANIYRQAGVDYICIREMGATTDVLSPRIFKTLIQPYLQKVAAGIDYAKILHICGSTNTIVHIMNECGYDALSLEEKNDLVKTRAEIGSGTLIFGAVDAYDVLANGTGEDVKKSVLKSLEGGVDGVWPGCDIWPTAPLANLKAMTETVEKFGAELWTRKKEKEMAS
ncbi:MtaA/CmuA family methyltransferase [Candidatus Formimonas warabiya]|uniref:Methyltransferase n=1 Tax=Formimonas warabiya TaxID=1761012 RepID=A0A3G1KSQ2_FORW1|nr:MtaA/CmuA family methyltransferase [Candidatus Formimonas warabiya]ATW25481.1 methyltransferase [Candidatus Formimonas warabiya]